jgi:DNA transposition AAA+ family ATPase
LPVLVFTTFADTLDADLRVATPGRILPAHALARLGARLHAFGTLVVLIGFERMSGIGVLCAGVRREEGQNSSSKRRP